MQPYNKDVLYVYAILVTLNKALVLICKLDIFRLMCGLLCATNKVWITELRLIHKNIRSVRTSHAQELTDIENYWSVWRQTHFDVADKINNASFKDLNKH
jgi:hypothetical protein